MDWARIDTEPLDVDSEVSGRRARQIGAALQRVAVPILHLRNGRAEPLASGALYVFGTSVLLLTCRHLFDDGVTAGDLGLPVGDSGRILWLRSARPRVLVDPSADLAAIKIGCRHCAGLLRRHWRAAPFDSLGSEARAQTYVLAGFPYAQMRRVGTVLHARPVVLFARGEMADGQLKLSYRRIARRADGLEVHAPALDGVSGATLWAVIEDGVGPVDCLLQPAAVQSSFKHDAFVRAEPVGGFFRLLRDRLS
ncbi:MAG TPA: hypothetical protein VH278_03140 [Burkholderiaceae bacterium]|jgi:hypothetical protein|nr:hypothetical protein [Burkholderiaceae bacterium]